MGTHGGIILTRTYLTKMELCWKLIYFLSTRNFQFPCLYILPISTDIYSKLPPWSFNSSPMLPQQSPNDTQVVIQWSPTQWSPTAAPMASKRPSGTATDHLWSPNGPQLQPQQIPRLFLQYSNATNSVISRAYILKSCISACSLVRNSIQYSWKSFPFEIMKLSLFNLDPL